MRVACALLICAVLTGCATSQLKMARASFRNGDVRAAETNLAEIAEDDTNRALVLMERGMIRQAAGDFKPSSQDWIEAVGKIRELDYVSVSRSTASLVTSDQVIAFRGYPYERTLLHAFAANNYFAMAMWDDAAVEARNAIEQLENLEGFPDDAYCRYLSGFCLEVTGDWDGARRQYEAADKLLEGIRVNALSGHFAPGNGEPKPIEGGELVCFVAIGHGPNGYGNAPGAGRWGMEPYAEFHANGQYLGRSYVFSDARRLHAETEKKVAALRAAKDIGRVVLKEGLAAVVADQNEALGALLWIVLFAFENHEERRWETLPMSLQVARMPCPQNLTGYTVTFKSSGGTVRKTKTVTAPITRRRQTYVSFCRDVP